MYLNDYSMCSSHFLSFEALVLPSVLTGFDTFSFFIKHIQYYVVVACRKSSPMFKHKYLHRNSCNWNEVRASSPLQLWIKTSPSTCI